MAINLIVAMTKDRVIGNEGELPWKILDDMRLFKSITSGAVVIMGKNTWLSIPEQFRPLPDRTNIIVSSTLEKQEGATVCKSVKEALEVAQKSGLEIFCIGGSKLYAEMLPIANIIHISWIKQDYDGDTYFPNIDVSGWNVIETREFPDFIYRKYERIISSSQGRAGSPRRAS
jgi:dihydrofolate reductase